LVVDSNGLIYLSIFMILVKIVALVCCVLAGLRYIDIILL
jgi:hypothetical protein